MVLIVKIVCYIVELHIFYQKMKNICYINFLIAQYQSLWVVLAHEHCMLHRKQFKMKLVEV